ncbi:MAG TPA: serine/threonine-protein kinase, partial [Polyangiaceae bacterium]|nr:serine/threonine-protein kinase [Polyangiaceae bacterium]
MKRMGRWELLGEIASGGMGTVYFARECAKVGEPERVAAVKVLHPHLEREVAFVRMFLDEAHLAHTISSPHVVETYELLEEGGRHGIAMQYVEGGSLAALVRMLRQRETPLDPGVALRVVHDTLLGLSATHEARSERGEPLDIVHRDVSPDNVLIDMDGCAKLTDFGVARARGRLHSTAGYQIKGKLRYLSPEQLGTSRVDFRSDLFSAGVVLWELLVGAPLFAAASDAEVMRRVSFMPIRPPCLAGARVPLCVDRVCLRALTREPRRRFAS